MIIIAKLRLNVIYYGYLVEITTFITNDETVFRKSWDANEVRFRWINTKIKQQTHIHTFTTKTIKNSNDMKLRLVHQSPIALNWWQSGNENEKSLFLFLINTTERKSFGFFLSYLPNVCGFHFIADISNEFQTFIIPMLAKSKSSINIEREIAWVVWLASLQVKTWNINHTHASKTSWKRLY